MKQYELFYLVSAHIPENQLETIQQEMSGWVTKLGGTITKQENWGRKKLAYPVNKEKFGFYLLDEFELESEKVAELQKQLRLHTLIMRYLLLDKKPLSAKDLALQEKARVRALSRSYTGDTPKESVKREESTNRTPRKDARITLEELDKKLDELLDTNIVS